MTSIVLFVIAYMKTGEKTLMIKRRKSDDQYGRWNGLGGKVEDNESPQEAMVREVKEESGLDVIKTRFGGVVTIAARGKIGTAVMFVFEVEKFAGNICESSEGKLAWIDDEKLRDLNLNEGDGLIFDWLAQGRFFSGKIVRNEGGHLLNYMVDYY